MSRVNQPHNYRSVGELAKDFTELSEKLVELSARFKKELGAKGKVRLAHQVSIDQGILAARKFIREAHTKLDNLADEKSLRR